VLAFDREMAVPAISDHTELSALLSAVGAFQDPAEMNETLAELQSATGGSDRVDLGVAEVLRALRVAQVKAQQGGANVAVTFATELADVINMNAGM
jgi:hypothetical protein